MKLARAPQAAHWLSPDKKSEIIVVEKFTLQEGKGHLQEVQASPDPWQGGQEVQLGLDLDHQPQDDLQIRQVKAIHQILVKPGGSRSAVRGLWLAGSTIPCRPWIA